MPRYSATVRCAGAAEEVFDYMADFANVAEWDPSAVRAEVIDGAAPGKGTRYSVVSRFMGRDVPLEYTTTEYKPSSLVTLRGENSTTISIDTITVRPLEGGSEMTYEADLQLKGVAKLLTPAIGLAFKGLGDRAADSLRSKLS